MTTAVAEPLAPTDPSIDPEVFPWSALGSDVVFVDLETSGGTNEVTRVIEFGAVRVRTTGEIERISSLIDPEGPITTTFVHGLEPADLEGAPTFAALWPRLVPWFKDTLIIAHKADFERSNLGRELERLGGRFGARMLCTLKVARRLHPERTGKGAHSLAGLQELYGLTPSGHEALADAESLAVLFTQWCRSEETLSQVVAEGIEPADQPWQWPEVSGAGALPMPREAPEVPPRSWGIWIRAALVILALLVLQALAWSLSTRVP
ncbi:MAG: 3'-5' exonuclease [Myxococcota bacterium]